MKIKKNKKYNPPIHCDEDRHNIKVGSKYFIFSKDEKPVPVRPDIASKKNLKKLLDNYLNRMVKKLIKK